MSAFPGPNSSVYYNDAGEPLGWDDNTYDGEYEYDDFDIDDRDYDDE